MVRAFLLDQHGVAGEEREKFSKILLDRLVVEIDAHPEPSDQLQAVKRSISGFRKGKPVLAAIDILQKRMPAFFYTSHFDRMSGEISLDKLSRDTQSGATISPGDQIFLDFLEYAGTSVSELQSSTRLEELNARCQAASNEITDEIFEFWSQNDALSVEIALAQGLSEDPAPSIAGLLPKSAFGMTTTRFRCPCLSAAPDSSGSSPSCRSSSRCERGTPVRSSFWMSLD